MMFTERDRKLFHLLGNFRIMTLKQIHEYVFMGVSRPVVQRRLGLWRKRGVLRSVQSSRYGQLAWTLVSETARAIDLDPRAFSRNPNLYCIEHDLMLSEIGLRWFKLGVVERWRPAIFFEIEQTGKNAIQYDHIPDARVSGGIFNNESAYVEYENSLKTRLELRRVIDHYDKLYIQQVFYFWRDPSIPRFLREIIGLSKHRGHHIWIADHSVEEGIADSFSCLVTGKNLDLKISGQAGTRPASSLVTGDAVRCSTQ